MEYFNKRGTAVRTSKIAAGIVLASAAASFSLPSHAAYTGPVDLGGLTDYLMVFTNGVDEVKWQSASKGYVGDVAVDGLQANEQTSGSFGYAGTITTNAASLGTWQEIVDNNPTQASGVTGATGVIADLESDFDNALAAATALTATSGYDDFDANGLIGLNTQNNVAEIFVIDITSGFGDVKDQSINITGDAGDFFVLRWDDNNDLSDGYDGEVKFQSGGGINPLGDLGANNFINVAGDINASGGGDFSAFTNLQDELAAVESIMLGEEINGGGLFTGYWLTTGKPPPPGDTGSMSNAIFVGGLYTETEKISLTSGTSGIYVAPIPVPAAAWLFGSSLLGLCLARRRMK